MERDEKKSAMGLMQFGQKVMIDVIIMNGPAALLYMQNPPKFMTLSARDNDCIQ